MMLILYNAFVYMFFIFFFFFLRSLLHKQSARVLRRINRFYSVRRSSVWLAILYSFETFSYSRAFFTESFIRERFAVCSFHSRTQRRRYFFSSFFILLFKKKYLGSSCENKRHYHIRINANIVKVKCFYIYSTHLYIYIYSR